MPARIARATAAAFAGPVLRHGAAIFAEPACVPASIAKCEPPRRFVVVPTATSLEPARFASIDTARESFSTGAKPEMSRVGGIWIVRPSSVTNWLLSESLPEMNGARYAFAAS